MTEKTFVNGKLERVYFNLGRFEEDPGKRRFIKAPFDIAKVDGEAYVMPISIVGVPGNDEGLESDLAQHFFFDSLENIVLERHLMGDWQSDKNNWLQVHAFGPV